MFILLHQPKKHCIFFGKKKIMAEAPITVATFNRVSSHLVLNHNSSIRPQILYDLGIEKDLMDSVKKPTIQLCQISGVEEEQYFTMSYFSLSL